MAAKKGIMSVSNATEQVFTALPEEFSLLDLIRNVRNKTGRPSLTDGTITRKLRLLREDKIIDYVVIDNQKAIYKKKGISLTGVCDENQMTIFDIAGV